VEKQAAADGGGIMANQAAEFEALLAQTLVPDSEVIKAVRARVCCAARSLHHVLTREAQRLSWSHQPPPDGRVGKQHARTQALFAAAAAAAAHSTGQSKLQHTDVSFASAAGAHPSARRPRKT